ncbi:MAG: SusC/RagA family TonB-linked outer membrane protein [Tenuifilaceae bacterium]
MMKMTRSLLKKTCLLSLLVILASAQLIAQKVTGVVVDESNVPIPGVSVLVKGTSVGIYTDSDGKYAINAPTSATTLIFSFVGMKTLEVEIAGRITIDVVLDSESLQVEELVVVGYGSIKKKDLTGSVGSVDSKTITGRGTTGVLQSMQGSVAGVNITQSSSRPGADYNIQVRGLNTFNTGGSPPLYVVDGIVTNDISFLNPQDIVKIDILKDASSTAIYGSRGSNGVVMVTTKTGQSVGFKDKSVVSYNGSYGVKSSARLPQQYTSRDWFDYRSHAYLQYALGAGDNGMADWKMVPSGVYMQNPEAARRAYEGDETDWLGALTQNGMQQNHYLNIAGNAGKMDYNAGIGFQDEDGIYIKENLKRYNLKLSLNYNISKKWMFGANTNFSQTEIEAGDADAYTYTFRMPPLFKIYDDSGNLLIQPGLVSNMGGVGANFTGNRNPIWEIETGDDNSRRYDVLASFYLQYSPIAGLDIKTNLQPRFQRNRIGKYSELATTLLDRTGYSENSEAFDYTWDNSIDYSKGFNGHNFKATGVFSIYTSRVETLRIKTESLPYDSQWYNLFSGTLVPGDSRSGYSEIMMTSYLGRLNYDYQGKYYLTASLRYDGSSKLADKWAMFPSFAAAWRLSEENFMKADFLSNLKLRYSYGQSGNNNVAAYTTFNGPQPGNMLYYNYGATVFSGFAPGNPVNPALTWEKTKESNLGLDFGFFKGRISGTVELYDRLSDGLLMKRKLAVESGVTEMDDNIGSVRNRGIELSLNTVNIQTRNFRWSTNFTFAKNINEIVSLYGRKEDVVGEKRFIGENINVIYDYMFNGVFSTAEAQAAAGNQLFSNYNPNPGHAKVVDTNGDGAITTADKVILGNTDPKWIGGFTTSMEFKNFDFNLSLIANYGRFVRDQFAANGISRNSRSQMMWTDPEDYYYPGGAPRPDWNNPIVVGGIITGIGFVPAAEENVDAKYPAYSGYDGPYYSAEAMNYREVSFVKIKNISLGYTFNKALLAKAGISKARIYLNVLDPFVFSDYVGWDPEYTTTSAVNGNGPSSITYQFGVSLEF